MTFPSFIVLSTQVEHCLGLFSANSHFCMTFFPILLKIARWEIAKNICKPHSFKHFLQIPQILMVSSTRQLSIMRISVLLYFSVYPYWSVLSGFAFQWSLLQRVHNLIYLLIYFGEGVTTVWFWTMLLDV